jgi:hypothetical protein
MGSIPALIFMQIENHNDTINSHTDSCYICTGMYVKDIQSTENKHILGNNKIVLEVSVHCNIVVSFLSLVDTHLL